jgi:hypothetical protein
LRDIASGAVPGKDETSVLQFSINFARGVSGYAKENTGFPRRRQFCTGAETAIQNCRSNLSINGLGRLTGAFSWLINFDLK